MSMTYFLFKISMILDDFGDTYQKQDEYIDGNARTFCNYNEFSNFYFLPKFILTIFLKHVIIFLTYIFI